MYVGAGDPRKNLYRLIEAYSALSPELIVKYKLVLAGKLIPEEVNLLESLMLKYRIPPEYIVLLGHVSDFELVRLYQNCYLFVFPSIHEGFGLPVLEAMTCGAAVIASNTSSIPEVIGMKEATFNPFSTEELSSFITRALKDEKFYQQLKSNSIRRSKLFSWEKTAQKVINAFNSTLSKRLPKDIATYDNNYFFNTINESLSRMKTSTSYDEYIKEIASSIDLNELTLKYFYSLDVELDNRCKWLLEGPFDSNYSLSILNKNLALAFDQIGVDIFLKSAEGYGDFEPNEQFLTDNRDLKRIYQKKLDKNNTFTISSRNLYPPRVFDMISNIKILHAYGWEESQFPDEWVTDFNYYLNGITVMSEFVKKTLIDNGVYLPIHVCGLGIDHVDHFAEDCNQYEFLSEAKTYKFLHISSCFPRKGIDILLRAYGHEFSLDDDVSLIIKTFNNQHNDTEEILLRYQKNDPKYPHVLVIKEDLSQNKLLWLYQSCNVLVAPSYGEGFGLPIAEAMYLGTPVITTGWGGQLDFCNKNNCWLLDFDFEYSKSHFDLTYSVWAIPSFNDLIFKMRQVYSETFQNLELKINNAKQTARSLSWSKVAEKNIDFIHSIFEKKSYKCPSIGLISTWNSKCGIASYASNLFRDIDENYIVLAPYDESLISADGNNVYRNWSLNHSDLGNLLDQIIKSNLSTVVIQFNFGFFDFISLNKFLVKLDSLKIKILFFLHSTIAPNLDKNLENIIYGLKLCKRIFVHTPADQNRLKALGLVHNVLLFPHGLPSEEQYDSEFIDLHENSKKYNLFGYKKRSIFRLATFGFCLPDKGFLELVEAISIIRNKGIDVSLDMYISTHGSGLSSDLLLKIENLINELNISSWVKVDSNFHEQKSIIEILSKYQLIVFPYQVSNESSSAAVRLAIVSGSPVIVTPLNVFDDVSDCVYKFDGCRPNELSEGLIKWLNIDSKTLDNISFEKKDSWIKQHNFYYLSKKLQGIIKSIEINCD